jgi:hypothetical protein
MPKFKNYITSRGLTYTVLILLLAGLGLLSFKPTSTYIQSLVTGKPVLKLRYINQWSGFLKDVRMLVEVLEEKYTLLIQEKDDDYDIVIDGVLDDKPITNQKSTKLLFTGEATDRESFDNYDLAMGFSTRERSNYLRLPLYYMINSFFDSHKVSTDFERGTCNPNKKYFACFLVANGGDNKERNFDGADKRNKMFHRLSLYKFVASGGPYLNNIGGPVERGEEATMSWLSQCKFVIAYENKSFDGYITEKPFQAYFGGAIPLYYSDPSAVVDINKKAIIYAQDFASEDAMVDYIKKVDQDDKLYCDIWNEKIILDPKRNYDAIKAKLRLKLIPIIEAKLHK